MGRLTYLVPRIIILALIVLAIGLGRDPLIQTALIDQAQNVTGAKVEIQQARSTFSSGKLYLKNIQIADPRRPMNNFFQADMAYVSLDLNELAHRRFVIKEGRSSEVVFGAPRTQSGVLNDQAPQSSIELANVELERDYDAQVRKIGTNWVDQIQPAPSVDADTQLEVSKVGKQLRDQWVREIQLHRQALAAVAPEISKIRSSLTKPTGLRNPLRQQQQESLAKERLQQLETKTAETLAQLEELKQRVATHKNTLQQARQRDRTKLTKFDRVNEFDGETISQLLLYERQGNLVDEAVQWLRWFRMAMIDPEQDLSPKNQRGVNVAFRGVDQAPKFLIKELELEGEGRFAKQHLNFAGKAYNLTTQPRHHSHPAIFELRAQGSQHVIVKCEIDRRTETPIDRLSIQCPDFELDSELLGHSDSLLVSMGPASRVQAEIQIELHGDQLSGTLSFHHSKVALHVDQLHPLAGGAETALRINQHLVGTNKFKTQVQLSGTLDTYDFDFQSNLGPQIAKTVTNLVNSEIQQKLLNKKKRIDDVFQTELNNLDQVVAAEIKAMVGQLSDNSTMISELQDSIRVSEQNSWNKIR